MCRNGNGGGAGANAFLLPQLDIRSFWQIHRGTVVQSSAIDSVLRDEAGKLTLSLRGRPEKLAVSRMYSQQFRAM